MRCFHVDARRSSPNPNLLDADELARLARLSGAPARAYLVAHVALRVVLAGRLECAPADIGYDRAPCVRCGAPHGRPVLRGGGAEFSLARSAAHVLIVVDDQAIGVDVELVRDSGAASSQLHPRERAALAAAAPSERNALFAACWTRKEAYLKAVGVGLAVSPGDVYTGLPGEQPTDGVGFAAVSTGVQVRAALVAATPPGLASIVPESLEMS